MSAVEDNVVRVGSRKSQLALIQTRYVISLLEQLYPEKVFEIVTMSTLGDRVLDISLPKIGEKALFTRELEDALRCGAVQLLVHSLKDLPTSLPNNMAIGAVLEREDPRDALVLREDFKGHTLASLPPGSIIGTSSLRRTAQISRSHPHLRVVDIRGNLNTRLQKLDRNCSATNANESASNAPNCTNSSPNIPRLNPICTNLNSNILNSNSNVPSSNPNCANGSLDAVNGNLNGADSGSGASSASNGSESGAADVKSKAEVPNYVALILAQAGLERMGWKDRISQVLPSKEVLYAVGQGALAIECMADNAEVLSMLAKLNHEDTYCRILAERSFLKTLGGGCSAPVAVATYLKEDQSKSSLKKLEITGAVWSLNGDTKIEESLVEVIDIAKQTNKPTGCPYEAKIKSGKHKMAENESSNDTEEPESKVFKSSESLCHREQSSENIVNCCRMKTMNSAVNNAEPVDIENLINIHGKLFKFCPFSEANRVCPVEYPSSRSDDCTSQYLSDTLVKMHPRRPSYDIKKCPFMANQVVAINSQMEMSNLTESQSSIAAYDIENKPKAKNCPFLKLETLSENNTQDPGDIKLFCGLTKHFNISEDVLDRCEKLGVDLANKLIERDALKVMQLAQNFIRNSIPTNSNVAK